MKTKGVSLPYQKPFHAIGAFSENDWAGIARITGEDFWPIIVASLQIRLEYQTNILDGLSKEISQVTWFHFF